MFETEGNEEESSLSLAIIKEADEFEEDDGEQEEELSEENMTTTADLRYKNMLSAEKTVIYHDDFSEEVEMWETEEY